MSLYKGYFQSDGTLKNAILKKEEIINWSSTLVGGKFNPESNSTTIIAEYTDISVNLILPGGRKRLVSYDAIISSDMIIIYWLKRNKIPSRPNFRNPPSEIKVKPVTNDYYAPRIAQLIRIKQDDSISYISNEEISPEQEYFEGSTTKMVVNRYERNEKARKLCIKYYGAICKVCGLDFENKYGEIGKGYIHVHHLLQLSEINMEYQVDPVKDLCPVCPNCHVILHKKNPPFTIEELRKIIKNQESVTSDLVIYY